MTRTPAILVPVLLLLAASCNTSPRARDAAGDLAAAACDLAFSCCSRGEINLLFGPYVEDGANCGERVVNSASLAQSLQLDLGAFANVSIVLPNLGNLQRAIADGRTEVDSAALDACLTYIAGLGCAGEEEPEPAEGCVAPPPPEVTPCDEKLLFRGRVGDGGACSSPGLTFECQEGLACRAGGGLGVQGACVRPGGVGDLCFGSQECQDDLYCSQLDGTCQIPRAEGEACLYADRDDPSPPQSTLLVACEAGLFCDPVTDRCVSACQRGASCSIDAQCDDEQGLICILGRCDLARKLGVPCGEDADCEADLRCGPNPAAPSESVCAERLADGEVCSFLGDAECQSGYCDQDTLRCAPTVAAGGFCPSARDLECADGYCESQSIFCTDDTPCLGSGSCNLDTLQCEFYCVEHRADDAPCDRDAHCQSGACVSGSCKTLPLADGRTCTDASQCDSGFCGFESPRVCQRLPLDVGEVCGFSNVLCASGICFDGLCSAGLREGDRCDLGGQPPCGRELYCDFQAQPAACVPVHGAGEACEGSFQCRGACVIAFGRRMCDATPPDEGAICTGP